MSWYYHFGVIKGTVDEKNLKNTQFASMTPTVLAAIYDVSDSLTFLFTNYNKFKFSRMHFKLALILELIYILINLKERILSKV